MTKEIKPLAEKIEVERIVDISGCYPEIIKRRFRAEEVEETFKNLKKELKKKRDEVCNMRNDTEKKMRKAIIKYFKFENKAFNKHIGEIK